MSLELSPSQERRLHSILDRGLDTLHESVENISRSTPGKNNWNSNLEGSYRDSSQKFSPKHTEKSRIINSELRTLQEKLATLEAKLSKKPTAGKVLKSKVKSPANHLKFINENSPRVQSAAPKKNESRERLKVIENSEKIIGRMERSITPSPARYKSTMKRTGGFRGTSAKVGKVEEKLKKENEMLKKEIAKMEELKMQSIRLQEENNKLMLSYERSENVRRKQKELISHLKSELRAFNDTQLSDGLKAKPKKYKLR